MSASLVSLGNGPLPYSISAGSVVSNAASPVGIGVPQVITVNGIDGTVIAATALLTIPAGFGFCVSKAVIRMTALTGAPTEGVMRIRNTTDSVDIIANTTVTGLTAVTKVFTMSPAAAAPFVPAAKVLSLDITTGYTVATVVTLSVDLHGYLF